MSSLIATLRAALFYTGYAVFTIVWGTISVLICWALPFRARFVFIIGVWTRVTLFWLRVCCGVRHRVAGLGNLPDTPCIAFVQHQSTWETAFAQTLLAPQATLIKRELLHIPFFGWAYSLLQPIAINRGDGRKALRQLIETGKDRLSKGLWVVLFPEGTRRPPGEVGPFFAGGASLASASASPVVVIAHNAGFFWPAHAFGKRSGVIDVRISPPISTDGKRAKDINAEASAWMQSQQGELVDAARAQLGELTDQRHASA